MSLPRFSDPKDIDEFVEVLEKFERAEISSDQFRLFRLARGTYGQRQEGVQMLRVKIPAGLLGSEQLEALADVADRYSRGFGHVTTRQNVQFHFMPMKFVEAAMRRLDEAGLTTREACGNSVRTLTACELAEVCSGAPFDVTPYAEALTRHFLRHPLSGALPRKFKTAFSGCAHDCAKAAIHDLGFIAAKRDDQIGFRVLCAGGLSSSPQAAIVLEEFVPASAIARVGEAIVRLFDRLGNRTNKHRARLKYVLRKLGEEKFRAAYAEVKAEVDAEALAELKLPPNPGRVPHPPVKDDPAPGLLAWKAHSIVDQKQLSQKQSGHVAVYVRLPLGDITSAQFRGLAKILERFGDGSLRTTIDQNILIPWVDRQSLAALHRALAALDLVKDGLHTARDVTSCPGAESCNLAVTSSRQLAAAIAARLDGANLDGLAGTSIKISGCPNSCGQHHIADLGWHGGAKTIGSQAIPVYQLHLGGGVGPDGARFGRQVVKIVAKRAPEATVLLLQLYESDRHEGETPTAFFQRVDAKRVVQALAPVLAPGAEETEASDIGEKEGFLVRTREGECAA
jgi:sulfite reductase beta subunit-like hemoprotein